MTSGTTGWLQRPKKNNKIFPNFVTGAVVFPLKYEGQLRALALAQKTT